MNTHDNRAVILEMAQPSIEILEDGSRADILSTAARCFMERGYTETSIDDVAERLGSTKGRIYHHFTSKAALFVAIFRTGMDMDYSAIAPHRDAPGAAITRLRNMAAAHSRQIIVSKPFQRVVWQGVQMLLRGATAPDLKAELTLQNERRDAYEQIFRRELQRARREGALRFDNLSLSAALMFVTLNSPIFWYTPRAGETAADINKLVVQVVTHAMRGLGSMED